MVHSYSIQEEIANAISHGLGLLLSVAGLTGLLILAINQGDPSKIVSYSIYGTSLIAMFLSSTLYHAITHTKTKQVFKLIDHCAIYLLIAGTYTPLLALSLKGWLGYSMLGVIWGLAAVGIGFKVKFGAKYKIVSLLSYLGMGFVSLFFINDLYHSLDSTGFNLLVVGGLLYGSGVFFYVQKKIVFNHAIWHLFVLGGAASHYFMILSQAN
jgi:hemolysin III